MLKAIIFDFNGVILDDEEYHYESLKRVLREEGVRITRDEYYRDCLGFGDVECFQWGLKNVEKIQEAGGMEALVARKFLYYEELLRKETRFFPGVCEFIRDIAGKYPLSVASMALRQEIDLALEKAGLKDLFSVIISTEDVEKTKPDPEVYKKALEQMNRILRNAVEKIFLQPDECLVIEDSAPGIQAAKSAGMPVLGLTHTVDSSQLGEADWILPSLEGISPAHLEAMFAERSPK